MNLLPQSLPLEIKNTILEYTDYHRLRNGKYMKQIPKEGRFYKKISQRINRIPQKINGTVIIRMSEKITHILFDPSFMLVGRRL
jgi:hypothetical protein